MVILRLHSTSVWPVYARPALIWKEAVAIGLMFLFITACSNPQKDSMMFNTSQLSVGFGSASESVIGSPGSGSIMEH